MLQVVFVGMANGRALVQSTNTRAYYLMAAHLVTSHQVPFLVHSDLLIAVSSRQGE